MAKSKVTSTPEDKPAKKLKGMLVKTKAPQYEESDISKDLDKSFALHSEVRTVPQLVALMEKDPNIQIDARVWFHEKGTNNAWLQQLGREKFIECFKNNKKRTFRESVDFFGSGSGMGGTAVGDPDYTPLLGGPFNKQLYIYDYLKMHAQSFYAYNHDPILHAGVEITRDFALGRDWSVNCKDEKAMALWKTFEELNDLRMLMYLACEEFDIYGENFFWWLPNNETRIAYQVLPGQEPPKGLFPRVRLIDPSVIWEIVTYPEDIKRVLYYQWVAPTQYQMYSGTDKGKPVTSTKFIYQQIPASDVDHYKINCRSNEKRGRSTFFSVLGYTKRLRDSVNFSIIGLQKAAAWSIDTTIEGSQDDVESYVESQQQLGTIPNPGSEFVHTDKIKREYLSNTASTKGNNSDALQWCFSMICAGFGIPQQYFGTHLSGGSTRASALVATEPVVKKFEMRRNLIEQILQNMAKRLFKQFGVQAEIEVTFPELVSQDRSTKLKDLALAEMNGWVSKRRAAEIAAKELAIMDYDYEQEQAEIKRDPAPAALMTSPLTAPGSVEPTNRAAISGDEKEKIGNNNGF